MTSTDPFGPGAGRATRRGDGDVGMRGQRRGVPVPPRREEVPVGARPDARRGSVGNRDGSPQAAEHAARGLSRSTLWDDADRGEGRFSGPQPLRARWDPVPPPRPRVGRRRARTERRRSAFGWFLHHYGWRAYALPVLAALTVVAVIGVVNSTDPPATEAAGQSGVVTVTMANSVVTTVTIAGPGATTTVGDGAKATQTGAVDPDAIGSGADATQVYAKAKAASSVPPIPSVDPSKAFQGVVMGALPPGNAFAKTGAGTFHVIPGTSEPFGSGADHRTFTVEAEDGVESAAADQQFADAVVAILSGPHSWAAAGGFTLQRIDSGTPDFRVTLTSQMTTRQAGFCGWEVPLEASCYNSAQGRVLINDARWMRGAYSYDGDLVSYRAYAINHEVGHALGYNHEACAVSGGPAPVMMQQSWSTADDDVARLNGGGPVPADGKVCRANPFVVSP